MKTLPFFGLKLPIRQSKPRNSGLTILIDNGISLNSFKDIVYNSAELVDFVKFGWGTSLITKQIEDKISYLQENHIHYFFGGTLFEKFLSQGKIDDFYNYCKRYQCEFIEISNGTIELENKEKAKLINEFSGDFHVFSEVGSKDCEKSYSTSEWIDNIVEDLEAGSKKVITESRESGTSGICQSNGEMRYDIIDEILSSGIPIEDIIFEAPSKKMQTYFIQKVGHQVNLANIPFTDSIPLETLRLGLRSDTFHLFERE
ncbi:phosphosulfolactate synthase [Alkalihalobacillus deserti]|uniref:phosphosulfolactate synthase n=1 Tax=Alkalihalobacillus deserti TaxID=2879466 RepID=UPI001D133ECC|nr:phosphosulfolactate synthase [Alkalihalobacillus deserti]